MSRDPVRRYACFELAWDFAVDAGDVEAAMAAAEALTGSFDLDEQEWKFKTFRLAAPKVGRPDEAFIRRGLSLIDEGVASGAFPLVDPTLAVLVASARKTGRPSLISMVELKVRDTRAIKNVYARYEVALGVLKRKPADPVATADAGRYLCFVKEDWAAGLPMLASGSDVTLKELARREAAARGASASAAAREASAAAWVAWAQRQPDSFRTVVDRHAADLRGSAAVAPPEAPVREKGFVTALKGHTAPVKRLAFSPTGLLLVSEAPEAPDNTTRIWDVRRSVELKRMTPSVAVKFSADGQRLALPTEGPKKGVRSVEVVDVGKWTSVRRFDALGKAERFAISSDGQRIASSTGADLIVADVASGRVIKLFRPDAPKLIYIGGIALSPDNKYVTAASGGSPKRFHLYDVEAGKELWNFESEGAGQFLSDGKQILIYGWGHWHIKDLLTGTTGRHGYRGGPEWYSADSTRRVCYSRDGDDMSIWLNDTINDKKLGKLEGHKSNPQAAAMSNDGRRVISGDSQGTVILWDAQTLLEQARLAPNPGAAAAVGVTSVALAPSGDVAAIGSKDGSIRLWVLPIQKAAQATGGAGKSAASPLAARPALDHFRDASWIWHAADSTDSPPSGKRYFRLRFDIPAGQKVVRAAAAITVDDQFMLYLNGAPIARSRGVQDDWRDPRLIDATAHLVPGTNTIAVMGENASGRAGLLLRLVVQFEGDVPGPMAVVSDKQWKSSDREAPGWERPQFDDAVWTMAREIKPVGNGAWGSGTLHLMPPPVTADADGGFTLRPDHALLHGSSLKLYAKGCIGSWNGQDDYVEWLVDVTTPGRYAVELQYTLAPEHGGAAEISVKDQRIVFTPPVTGSWETKASVKIGALTLVGGQQSIFIRPSGKLQRALLDVYSLHLERSSN